MVLSLIIFYNLSARRLLLLHPQDELVELVFGKAKFAGELLSKSGLGCAGGELGGDSFAQSGVIERGYLLCSDIRRGDDQGDLALDGIASGEVCGKFVCG